MERWRGDLAPAATSSIVKVAEYAILAVSTFPPLVARKSVADFLNVFPDPATPPQQTDAVPVDELIETVEGGYYAHMSASERITAMTALVRDVARLQLIMWKLVATSSWTAMFLWAPSHVAEYRSAKAWLREAARVERRASDPPAANDRVEARRDCCAINRDRGERAEGQDRRTADNRARTRPVCITARPSHPSRSVAVDGGEHMGVDPRPRPHPRPSPRPPRRHRRRCPRPPTRRAGLDHPRRPPPPARPTVRSRTRARAPPAGQRALRRSTNHLGRRGGQGGDARRTGSSPSAWCRSRSSASSSLDAAASTNP